MEAKDKLIGTVLIITGLFLVGIGAMTAMKLNNNNVNVVNPYSEVGVYEEQQTNIQEEQSLEPADTITEGQNETEVDVYAEDGTNNTITDESETEQEDEGSTRYIY